MKQDMQVEVPSCPRCGQPHVFGVTSLDDPVTYLFCPQITRRFKVCNFVIDLMPNVAVQNTELIPNYIRQTHGEADLQQKLERWREVRRANLWIPDDYSEPLDQVLQAYTHGLFFPAMTGACCLAEHVMNRLVIKLRDSFKSSNGYKRVYNRNKHIQDWKLLQETLAEWSIFSDEQLRLTKKLHRLRTDSVHYVPAYDFQSRSTEAITLLVNLLDSLFSALHRTDIFRVFEIPGEIWVRDACKDHPFVREFVVPHCAQFAVNGEFGPDGYFEYDSPTGPLSEDEFIRLRREYQQEPERHRNGYEATHFSIEYDSRRIQFVVP